MKNLYEILNVTKDSSIDEIIIIIGYQSEIIKNIINKNKKIKFIFNKNYKKGMSTSIKYGLSKINKKGLDKR